jgi:hypothetical protein
MVIYLMKWLTKKAKRIAKIIKLLTTAVWRDWGFRLNGKLVLYLENLCLTEKSRIFNPQPRQAPER